MPSSIHNKAKGKKEKIVKGWVYNYSTHSSLVKVFVSSEEHFKIAKARGYPLHKAELHIKLPCRNNRKGMRGE